MDTGFWVGIILGLGGTLKALFSRSPIRSSRIMRAAEKEDLEKFKKRIRKRKPKINDYGINGNRPLHIAAGKWANENMISEILQKGADINIRNVYGQTPLHFAADFGHQESMKILIQNGADVNAKDRAGNTPLSIALRQKRKKPIHVNITNYYC